MKDSGHTNIYILQRLTLQNKNKQKPKMGCGQRNEGQTKGDTGTVSEGLGHFGDGEVQ